MTSDPLSPSQQHSRSPVLFLVPLDVDTVGCRLLLWLRPHSPRLQSHWRIRAHRDPLATSQAYQLPGARVHRLQNPLCYDRGPCHCLFAPRGSWSRPRPSSTAPRALLRPGSIRDCVAHEGRWRRRCPLSRTACIALSSPEK